MKTETAFSVLPGAALRGGGECMLPLWSSHSLCAGPGVYIDI